MTANLAVLIGFGGPNPPNRQVGTTVYREQHEKTLSQRRGPAQERTRASLAACGQIPPPGQSRAIWPGANPSSCCRFGAPANCVTKITTWLAPAEESIGSSRGARQASKCAIDDLSDEGSENDPFRFKEVPSGTCLRRRKDSKIRAFALVHARACQGRGHEFESRFPLQDFLCSSPSCVATPACFEIRGGDGGKPSLPPSPPSFPMLQRA